MLHTPIIPTPAITLAEATVLHAYAKRRYAALRETPLPAPTDYLDAERARCIATDRRDMVAITFAAAAVIDGLNGCARDDAMMRRAGL